MESEKAAVLKTVTAFLSTIGSNGSSLQDARNYVLTDSFAALFRSNTLIQSTIGETLTRFEEGLASMFAGGVSSMEEIPCSPGPEVWIYDSIAAVWLGYKHLVDGKVVKKGVDCFALLKTSPEERWRIAGLADNQWEPDQPDPSHVIRSHAWYHGSNQ